MKIIAGEDKRAFYVKAVRLDGKIIRNVYAIDTRRRRITSWRLKALSVRTFGNLPSVNKKGRINIKWNCHDQRKRLGL